MAHSSGQPIIGANDKTAIIIDDESDDEVEILEFGKPQACVSCLHCPSWCLSIEASHHKCLQKYMLVAARKIRKFHQSNHRFTSVIMMIANGCRKVSPIASKKGPRALALQARSVCSSRTMKESNLQTASSREHAEHQFCPWTNARRSSSQS